MSNGAPMNPALPSHWDLSQSAGELAGALTAYLDGQAGVRSVWEFAWFETAVESALSLARLGIGQGKLQRQLTTACEALRLARADAAADALDATSGAFLIAATEYLDPPGS